MEYYTNAQGKVAMSPYCGFSVKSIEYDDRRNISGLVIVDAHGNERFRFGGGKPKQQQRTTAGGVKKLLSDAAFEKAMARLNNGEKSLIDKLEQTYMLSNEQKEVLAQYR